MPSSGVKHLSQEPRGATEEEEHYCFDILAISFQPQFGTWIVGVLEWTQRDQGEGCTDFQVRGGSDIGRGYREEMASGYITEAESLWLSDYHSWGFPEACPRQRFKCKYFIWKQAAQRGREEVSQGRGGSQWREWPLQATGAQCHWEAPGVSVEPIPLLSHLRGRVAGVFIHQLSNSHWLRVVSRLGEGRLLRLWQFLPATCGQNRLQLLEKAPLLPTGMQMLMVGSQSVGHHSDESMGDMGKHPQPLL